MHTTEWTVAIFLSEPDDNSTAARAVLSTGTTTIEGFGTAHRNPSDRPIPEIGDELAVSRALSELAHRLLDVAAEDVSAAAGRA
jgi:hypothetical protein